MSPHQTRGGSVRATLYRLWPSKPKLIASALRGTRPLRIDQIDTGSLRGDLVTLCERLIAHAEADTLLFAALTHAALMENDLAAAMRGDAP